MPLNLDLPTVLHFNSLIPQSPLAAKILSFPVSNELLRNFPFFLSLVTLWFVRDRPEQRAKMLSGILGVSLATAISVVIQAHVWIHLHPSIDPTIVLRGHGTDLLPDSTLDSGAQLLRARHVELRFARRALRLPLFRRLADPLVRPATRHPAVQNVLLPRHRLRHHFPRRSHDSHRNLRRRTRTRNSHPPRTQPNNHPRLESHSSPPPTGYAEPVAPHRRIRHSFVAARYIVPSSL